LVIKLVGVCLSFNVVLNCNLMVIGEH
jgi:hypothetical protein